MVPVNEVTPEGQPRLWIQDLPPVSRAGVPEITQPRIYFGESDNHYVVVGARQAEFDYPRDGGTTTVDETTRWTGKTGIPLDYDPHAAPVRPPVQGPRPPDLGPDHGGQPAPVPQDHQRAAEAVAPFLRYDKDPYLVIDDAGRLVYVQDAYTISDSFPQRARVQRRVLGGGSGLAGDKLNYIRNSVKITIDAYDGTMHFYVADPSDPIIRAWQGVFPGVFEPMGQMPAGLLAHLRVPEELFNVQSRMLRPVPRRPSR